MAKNSYSNNPFNPANRKQYNFDSYNNNLQRDIKNPPKQTRKPKTGKVSNPVIKENVKPVATYKTAKGKIFIKGSDGNYYKAAKGNPNSVGAKFENGRQKGFTRIPASIQKRLGPNVEIYDETSMYVRNNIKRTNSSKHSSTKRTTTQTSTPRRTDLATKKNTTTSPSRTATPRTTAPAKTSIPKVSTPRTATPRTIAPRTTYANRVSSSTPNGNYTVNQGDSLWKIAHDNGLTLNELMSQNPQIKNINQIIRPGDTINVNNRRSNNSTTSSNTESTPSTTESPTYGKLNFDDILLEGNLDTQVDENDLRFTQPLPPVTYNYKKKRR